MRPRAGGFRCRILDNELFVLNLSGSCGSVMTLGQTASDKQARAPDTSLFNWWQQSLCNMGSTPAAGKKESELRSETSHLI